MELVDVPMTLAGLSRFNIENALAAASAALAIGLPARGRRGRADVPSCPDAEHNPGRMNFFSLPGDVSVVMDLAHNEAGLEALLEIMGGVRRPGARLMLGLGAVGDRTDELIDALGEIGAKGSDVVAIGHKEHYLRGRTIGRDRRSAAGRRRAGRRHRHRHVHDRGGVPGRTRRAGRAGDVVGLMCHAERQEAYDWIAEHGGTADTPETLSRRSAPPRRDADAAAQASAGGV